MPRNPLNSDFFSRIKDRVQRELGNPSSSPSSSAEDGPGQDYSMSPGLWGRILDRAKDLLGKSKGQPSPSEKKYPTSERLDLPTIRNRIHLAGQQGVMLLLRYNGVNRLVEPYSFRVRMVKPKVKNGVPHRQEYFHAWCSIHGGDHTEAFKIEKIEGLWVTDKPFTPRWTVEV